MSHIVEIIVLIFLVYYAEAIRKGEVKHANENPKLYWSFMWVSGVVSGTLMCVLMQAFLLWLDTKK